MEDLDALLHGLGVALQEIRREKGLSQEELSLLTGVHRNYIGGVERGERSPTVATVAKLGRALDIQLSELFARVETAHSD